ncbi:MAG: hypothetical protein WCV00_11490 [Verrucomicrobiia bacterium]
MSHHRSNTCERISNAIRLTRASLLLLAANLIVSHAACAEPLRLLFSTAQDVTNTWGKLHFGVTPVRLIRECEPSGFPLVGGFPRPDGSWEVFGQQMTEMKRGDETRRVMVWKLLRANTRDGIKFENVETVFESEPAAWTDHFAIARNADSGEYLALKLKVDDNGFAYTAFFSPDGKRWAAHPGNPLFYDGDAMSLFWSKALHRFVVVSKSFQQVPGGTKRIVDHGGKNRRVLALRSSPDGRAWDPSDSLQDVWNRRGRAQVRPDAALTVPDAADPPDLEFYSGNGFWYRDRAYMMVLNYAASPLALRKHAPQLDNEWWTSRDGLRWERPARGVNALEVFPKIARLETHPLIVGGKILFVRGRLLLGLPEDRISFVASRANAEFSTASFQMPQADLSLNAAVPSPERAFATQQAYVMAAVLDDKGEVVPGFEREKCIIQNADKADLPLRWNGKSARELAGRNVRLRFFLRSANIYAVTSASNNR